MCEVDDKDTNDYLLKQMITIDWRSQFPFYLRIELKENLTAKLPSGRHSREICGSVRRWCRLDDTRIE